MSEPRASRPSMPGYGLAAENEGQGLLPFQWARERLERSRNYFVSSVRPDGRPHSMPVWGVSSSPLLDGDLLISVAGAEPNGKIIAYDKKTGHGAGKINAPGGKLEADETPQACAIRETLEEVGVKVERPRLAAELKFADTVASQWLGYVFVAHEHSGNATESAEADPHWYALDAVPYERMWQDDRIWLPLMLDGTPFRGRFIFDGDVMLDHEVEEG